MRIFYIFLSFTIFLMVQRGYAQAPRFRDPPPQVYTVNTPITPLLPDNRGGAVPATIYGEVTTFAGNGSAAFVNAKGTGASFNNPLDVKLDSDGNLYVTDAGNNMIRKIAPDGTVSTFAGSTAPGSANGTGASARFSNPYSLTIDAMNNIYVVDKGNYLIRKLTPAGVVTTFAGVAGTMGMTNNTFNDPCGIAIDKNGVCFVNDNIGRVREVHPGYVVPFVGGGNSNNNLPVNGPGAGATFRRLSGITINADGDLFTEDAGDYMIRKINSSAVVSSFAGIIIPGSYDGTGGSAGFTDLRGITVDAYGTFFITDGNLIRRMDSYAGVTTIAGSGGTGSADGIGRAASFNMPTGLGTDGLGYVYIADAGNNLIRKLCYTGYTISPALPAGLVFDQKTGTISGTPTESSPAKDYTVFGYNIYGKSAYTVNIQVNKAVRMPQVITFPPLPQKKQTDFDFPAGATSSNNSLPISYSTSDISVASIADGQIHINGPGTVIIYASQKGNSIYSDAPTVSQVLVITEVPILKFPTITIKPAPVVLPLDGTGNLKLPYDAVATVTGESDLPKPVVKLSDSLFDCSKIGPKTITVSAGYGPDPFDPLNAKFNYPSRLVYDNASGSIYISDPGNYVIRKIMPNGRVGTLAGSGAPGDANGKGSVVEFGKDLLNIATDSQGNVYVCDVANFKIKKIAPNGQTTTFGYDVLKDFTSEVSFEPKSIAIDKLNNVYVSDGNIIVKISPDGNTATLLAGSGKQQNTDGTGATASFNNITGLFAAANGNIYVSSSDKDGINSVRIVTPAGVVTTLKSMYSPLLMFTSLVVDSNGNVFIASSQTEIYKITPAGDLSIFAGTEPGYADGFGTSAKLYNPAGITIDASNNIYIADSNNHRIRKITPSGVVTTIAGSTSGYMDNTDKTNTASKQTQVVITSPINLTSPYSTVTIPFLDACPATVPDYTKIVAAKSPCTSTFHFTQSPAAGTVINNGQVINVVITATDDLSTYDQGSVTIAVTAAKLPTPTVAINPSLYDGCTGDKVTYTATIQNGGSNPTYEWLVNNVAVYNGGGVFNSSALVNGDKIICIVTNHDGCIPVASAPSNIATLNVFTAASFSAAIFTPVNTPVCPGSRIDFTALPINATANVSSVSYQWQVNNVNKGDNSANFSSTGLADGDVVSCILTVNGKCVVNTQLLSNSITVGVLSSKECDIIPPNTFTPNGDGVNDTWAIPILKNYPASTINIFNRYGTRVYQSTGYNKFWDGVYQGGLLPSGVYYYLIDTHSFQKRVSGYVTIIR